MGEVVSLATARDSRRQRYIMHMVKTAAILMVGFMGALLLDNFVGISKIPRGVIGA